MLNLFVAPVCFSSSTLLVPSSTAANVRSSHFGCVDEAYGRFLLQISISRSIEVPQQPSLSLCELNDEEGCLPVVIALPTIFSMLPIKLNAHLYAFVGFSVALKVGI